MKQFIYVIALFLGVYMVNAQQTITGKVQDQDGIDLPGASIVVDGTNNATTTDFDGNFTISANNGDKLIISFVGYEAAEVVVDGNDVMAILSLATELEEVVVTGYGVYDKKRYTGSAVTIDTEPISRKNISNISRGLVGEASGLTVVSNSGQPGTSATVRIRGKAGSVNGNSAPLYVLDGVPYNGNINAINPNDIETTTILKDAAATAIYGNRGANGVILITTKRGDADEARISVDIKSGSNTDYLPRYSVIESPEKWTELVWESLKNRGTGLGQNGAEYAQARLFSSAGLNPKYNMWNAAGDALIDPSTGKFNTSIARRYDPEVWRDYAFNDARRNEVNVSISGGSKTTQYYYSVGALEDVGYGINSDFRRYSTRLNLDFTPYEWLTAKTNFGYSYAASNFNGQSSDSGSIFWTTANMPRIYPLFERDADGNKIKDVYGGFKYDYGEGRGFAGLTNSIGDAYYNTDKDLVHNLNINQQLSFALMEGVKFESLFSINYLMDNTDFVSDPTYGSSRGQGGYISKSKFQQTNWTLRNALRFERQLSDRFFLMGFLAHESERFESSSMNANKYTLLQPRGPISVELDNAVKNNTSSSSTSAVAREAYVAYFNLKVDEAYNIAIDFRRDSTSIFPNDKWGNFGSVSLGWILSEEDFFNVSNISFFKLRTSYGILGEALGEGFYPGYDRIDVKNLNDQVATVFISKGNPDLTWEAGKQFNFGIDLESSYANATIDFYSKNREDMFFTREVGTSLGYRSILVNDGSLRNWGIEFAVDKDIVKTDDFNLNVRVLGSIEKNELTELPFDPAAGRRKYFESNGFYGLGKGKSTYEFYMRDYAGVNPDTGYAQWFRNYDDKNSNGSWDNGEEIEDLFEYKIENPNANILEDKVERYVDATKRFTGKTAIPDMYGSITLSASYKAFDMRAIFSYGLGGYAYDSAYRDFMDNESAGNTQQLHTDIENRWKQAGDVTDVPILNSNLQVNQASTSTRFLIEADYLNFSNIQVGYTLPDSLTQKINASNVRIYFTGDNLMILSKRDGFNPGYSLSGNTARYTYEPMTTFTAGLTLNF